MDHFLLPFSQMDFIFFRDNKKKIRGIGKSFGEENQGAEKSLKWRSHQVRSLLLQFRYKKSKNDFFSLPPSLFHSF